MQQNDWVSTYPFHDSILFSTKLFWTPLRFYFFLDGPSVKFTAAAFKDPVSYLNGENIEEAKSYKFYFEGIDNAADEFNVITITNCKTRWNSHSWVFRINSSLDP